MRRIGVGGGAPQGGGGGGGGGDARVPLVWMDGDVDGVCVCVCEGVCVWVTYLVLRYL